MKSLRQKISALTNCLRGVLRHTPAAQNTLNFVPKVRLSKVGKGYSETSVNTAVFRNNSIVTQGDEQYISYYDPKGYLVLGKRKLGSDRWTVNRTQYKGSVKDAHRVISIMLDSDGYIHAAFDHHVNTLNYCRSIAPHSLELGEKERMTNKDENKVTYPEFYPLAGGGCCLPIAQGYQATAI